MESLDDLSASQEIAPEIWGLLDGCTDYQRAWFANYVGAAGFNAAEAARMAGSSSASAAKNSCRMKQVPGIAAAIAAYLRRRGVSRERILERLAQVAFADAGEALDQSGRFSAARMRQHGLAALVRKVTYHSESKGGGIQSVEFESPVRALELLGRATSGGMFRDNASVEHSGEVAIEHRESFDYYQLSDEDLRELERLHVKATGLAQLDAPSGSG